MQMDVETMNAVILLCCALSLLLLLLLLLEASLEFSQILSNLAGLDYYLLSSCQ